MAKITTLRCDGPCGQSSEDVRTRTLAFDGRTVELELCDTDAKLITELTELGRPVGAPAVAKRRSSGTTQAGSDRSNLIRAWAREHNIEVMEKGRISKKVQEAYDLANAS